MANLGEKQLNLSVGDSGNISSCFQIAQVTRPLMSVGKICDQGMSVAFMMEKRCADSPGPMVGCTYARCILRRLFQGRVRLAEVGPGARAHKTA